MPCAGICCSPWSRRFAVGNPSVRPTRSPPTTSPVNAYGRPRSSPAVATRPSARSARMRLLVTGAPAASWSGSASTSKPNARPSSRSLVTFPERPRPSARSCPTTSQAGANGSTMCRATNTSGSSAASSRVNGSTWSSTPSAAMRACFSGSGVSGGSGRNSRARTMSGWGSKLTAIDRLPAARSRVRSSRARWPRWRPSKTPTATAPRFPVALAWSIGMASPARPRKPSPSSCAPAPAYGPRKHHRGGNVDALPLAHELAERQGPPARGPEGDAPRALADRGGTGLDARRLPEAHGLRLRDLQPHRGQRLEREVERHPPAREHCVGRQGLEVAPPARARERERLAAPPLEHRERGPAPEPPAQAVHQRADVGAARTVHLEARLVAREGEPAPRRHAHRARLALDRLAAARDRVEALAPDLERRDHRRHPG